jgi:RNA recognition motif-containing protein
MLCRFFPFFQLRRKELNLSTFSKDKMTKSNAQIRRAQKRAETRGETYVISQDVVPDVVPKEKQNGKQISSLENLNKINDEKSTKKDEKNDKIKLEVAMQLKNDLALIEGKSDLKAKDRRAAKRKAEAIAAEAVGCSATELLDWYQQKGTQVKQKEIRKRKTPYIVFIGQLSYETTSEDLFLHIQTELKDDNVPITNDNLKIRLLTKKSTKESRGMAFVEVQDPETLYALLKLHHTFRWRRS